MRVFITSFAIIFAFFSWIFWMIALGSTGGVGSTLVALLFSFITLLFFVKAGHMYGFWGTAPSRAKVDPETGEVFMGQPSRRAKEVDRWEESLRTIWEGQENIEFSYEDSKGGKSRRKLTLLKVMVDRSQSPYLRGFCHLREEERTFNAYSITSKILFRSQRYEWEDFLTDKLGIPEKKLGW